MIRILLITSILSLPLFGGATSIFDRLNYGDVNVALAATLTFPLDSILARSDDDHKGSFSFFDEEGRGQHWSVKISGRGKFRRARCEIPPLKLDFSKKDLRAKDYAEFDKYKLVLPCFGNPLGEELVMKEYLAYQAYQLLTPFSFRTQLLRLTIRDANGQPDRVVTAFMIENTDEMAQRNGGEEAEPIIGAPASAYDSESEATQAMFQYFIGNGDWSLLLRRNVKVIKVDERYIPVGYDFDFTGFVGAPYATATSDVGQLSIYERVYLGYAQPDDVIQKVNEKFRDRRRAILNLIANAHLDPDSRMIAHRFATRFFSRTSRLRSDENVSLYDQLRGETAAYLPSGESAEHYRSMGK